ncbi:MAG TPA: hypothetical protein V6C97_32505 [Oculatellaceae cyanobacterium]
MFKTFIIFTVAMATLSLSPTVKAGEWVKPQPTTTTTTTTAPSTSPTPTQKSSAKSDASLQSEARQKSRARASASSADLKRFLDAVRENFAYWDKNHDGCIDGREIRIASIDDRYHGDTAAALTVLKILADTSFEKNKELFLLKLADLDAIQDKGSCGVIFEFDYGNEFQRLSKKLKTQQRALFTGNRAHLSSLRIGPGGDGCFAAAAGSLAEVAPSVISNMLKQEKDQYVVSFPEHGDIQLPPLTDAEVLEYADNADGYWFYLLLKGYNEYRSTVKSAENDTTEKSKAPSKDASTITAKAPSRKNRQTSSKSGKRPESTPNAELPEPNECCNALAALSGTTPKSLRLNASSEKNNDTQSTRELLQSVLESKSEKHIMTIALKQEQAFVITEYDTVRETLTIRNLSGSSSNEKWTDGNIGPKMSNGYFSCTLSEFTKNFQTFWYAAVQSAPQ